MSKEAIVETLNDYAKAYCAKDISAMMQVFDASDNISVIGTGEDETCVGLAEVKALFARNFQEATATQFDWDWLDIRISNNHAIASVKLTIHLETIDQELSVPIRWSVVLKYSNNRWLWIHRNASVAASGQKKGQAYPEK